MPKTEICVCGVCRQFIYEGDATLQHIVLEFDGTVDYIELAHEECANRSGATFGYWS